jgi:hypothetical protein
MGPTGCPETSVRIYHHYLRNIPEERSSHLFRGESLKSVKQHENLDLTRVLKNTKLKNSGTDSSPTVFLKTILHSENFQKVLNNKEPCAKQKLLTYTASG